MVSDTMTESRMLMVQNQLSRRGIRSAAVLDAFRTISRHLFVPKESEGWAYDDCPLSIGFGQTISQPYIVALMTEVLNITKEDIILEIGTGSGYQTAILASLGKSVYTIERIPSLQIKAKQILDSLHLTNVNYLVKDGNLGWNDDMSFDKIIVTAAAGKIPEKLLGQLRNDGLMVIPCGGPLFQELLLIQKQRGKVIRRNLGACRFVPLVGSETADS